MSGIVAVNIAEFYCCRVEEFAARCRRRNESSDYDVVAARAMSYALLQVLVNNKFGCRCRLRLSSPLRGCRVHAKPDAVESSRVVVGETVLFLSCGFQNSALSSLNRESFVTASSKACFS
ncbi:unnamed protein product [Lathyrus sativus]|nr:unnamed protein product [Lathyrus sativus]